jgi:hypothetical protein
MVMEFIQVTVTTGGCTSAAASYNYQKQNLVSSYTILAFDDINLGTNNIVASGSWCNIQFRRS